MNNLDLLTGFKILEEIDSPINGKIRVVKDLAFGTHIQVENLTQSGGVVYEVWESTLHKVKSSKLKVKSCLILGLGGGSAATLIRKFWPQAKITGVDLDSIMVEMGKKYLGLDKTKVDIQIQDAYAFITQNSKLKSVYDLILVDLYQGDKYPKKFESEKFISFARRGLAKQGLIIFNRLYYGAKRAEAIKFGKKLEKIFSKVDYFYPEANLMFLCSK